MLKFIRCLAKGGGGESIAPGRWETEKCPGSTKISIFKNQSKTEIKKINERQTVNFLFLSF